MSYRDELDSLIARLQERLRLAAWLRGAAIFTGTALLVTLALVLVLNHFAFPSNGVTFSRLIMLSALAAAAFFGIALPVQQMTRGRAVRHAEAASPEFGQRLTTYHERTNQQESGQGNDPFLELLAADTLRHAQSAEPATLAPGNRLFALGGAGFACLAVLVWMIAAGPGYLGYGASLLWTGPRKKAAPLYSLIVSPGNITARRNSDQLITARLNGMETGKAQLFARYQSAGSWEPVTMQRAAGSGSGATFQFVFAGLPESVEYFVGAGPLVSPHYHVRVVDLPSVKEIHVTYRYPAWTGMKPVTEEHSGDLRAIEGTDAVIQVETDRPLKDGQFVLDNGQAIHLAAPPGNGSRNLYQGSIHMEKDGAYHLAATDEGQAVRLSEDYFIATDKAAPPQVSIARPGGDYRASPIEEVTIGVKGNDDFGLKDMHLHYSVNGGPDHDLSLLKTQSAKEAEGSFTLPIEDFKLVPGDLVSIYATARDGHAEARTDISFIQIDPFEREFSQSQQSGGGGGGGGRSGDSTEISKREKELIAATWKQRNDKVATPTGAAAQGEFLSQAQTKLRDQVNALSIRMQSRDIDSANQEFTDFDRDMRDAAAAMAPSAQKLQSMQWNDAIPLEQKALQALLRAEATFRNIQVAFGQQGGGGGGGGNSGRDLASLFDLELDTAKNQYETAQSASPAEQREKEVEDTLARLDALAKRQEDLANRQQNPQQSFQERWEQEMLRREAEQLQRQMEQLAQNGQQSANGSQSSQSASRASSSSQSSSGAQPGAQNRSGSPSSNSASSPSSGQSSNQQPGRQSEQSQQSIEQALSRLRQATDVMKRSGDGGRDTNAQMAAEQLRQASGMLAGTQQQLATGRMESLAHEAERLRQEERTQAGQIGKFSSQQDTPKLDDLSAILDRRRELNQLAQDRQQLSDGLSNLQKNLRDAAREMAANQPGVAQSLRNALSEMDNSDLDNRVQRSADWLRRGIDPTANGAENEISQGLDKLSQQLRQAQDGLGQAKSGQRRGSGQEQAELVEQVEQLRSQIESMTRSRGSFGQTGQTPHAGKRGQSAQGAPSGESRAPGNDGLPRYSTTSRLNSNGQQPGPNQPQQSGIDASTIGSGQASQSSALSGNVRSGGGRSVDGTVWNNVNTGNNSYGTPRQQTNPATGDPAGTEDDYQLGMRELNQLRKMVASDPQAAKDLAELTRQMQHLDPSRFPGNPAMVEQMQQEILSSLDRIELHLERDSGSTDARIGKPDSVPAGYRESVSEYYRQLSKNP